METSSWSRAPALAVTHFAALEFAIGKVPVPATLCKQETGLS